MSFFTVEPKRNCPHVCSRPLQTLDANRATAAFAAPCAKCGDRSENWVCLECGVVLCARMVKGHMEQHHHERRCAIVSSLSDLSTWCYVCDSYIVHPTLQPSRVALYRAKFGRAPPDVSVSVTNLDEDTVSFAPPLAQAAGSGGGGSGGGGSGSDDHRGPEPERGTYPPPTPLATPEYQPIRQGYGHTKAEDLQEFEDSPEVMRAKVRELAALIRHSRHMVAYTGAGISTSASIPDYRGPQGVWTMRDQGKRAACSISLEQAVPTGTHLLLTAMQRAGLLQFVVSTNVDGLHRRSGLPADSIAELHGNVYVEVCLGCHRVYTREHDVHRRSGSSASLLVGDSYTPTSIAHLGSDKLAFLQRHGTGRVCQCGGPLCDSIVHFEEALPQVAISLALRHAVASDLALVLGTSMRVAPANQLPLHARSLVIVNLQRTPYDAQCRLRLWSRTDQVMEALAAELHIEPATFDAAYWATQATHDAEQAPIEGMRVAHDNISEHVPRSRAERSELAEGAVAPIAHCPHVRQLLAAEPLAGLEQRELYDAFMADCAVCGDGVENWLCLHCKSVLCSRARGCHMAEHCARESEHALVASLSDLSVWCYACDNYVTSPLIAPLFDAMHRIKHGAEALPIHGSAPDTPTA